MKKLLIVLFSLFLFTYQLFPQWSSETNLLSVNSGTKVGSCVSASGSHVVYSSGGDNQLRTSKCIRFYRLFKCTN